MLFRLPELLAVEVAGRAMALRVNQPVEIGVAPCLAGAAALVAARLLMLRGVPVSLALTDPSAEGDTLFRRHLRLLQKMGARLNIEENASDDFPCVISGTDNSATMGSSSFLVAKAFLDPAHALRWDGWFALKNPFLSAPDPAAAVTAAEAREIDRRAAEEFHLPTLCLMEHAGIGAAVIAAEMAGGNSRTGEIVVLAGPGNNGGDAFVLARGLLEKGVPVRVIPLAGTYDGDAEVNLNILRQQPHFIDECRTGEALDKTRLEGILKSARLIVDGLFGTGLSREVSGEYAEVIGLINASAEREVPVLSLDVPSGLDADTGAVRGVCVNATRTVTFAAPKKGLYLKSGPAHTGKLHLASIGNPT